MARGGRKAKDTKHVGFRMPLDLYGDYLAVAEARGVDLTALFCWALSEFRPALLLRHEAHRAALRAANEPEANEERKVA
jgi:hypothetical protein